MKIKKVYLIAAALIISLALAATGCGGSKSKDTAADKGEKGPARTQLVLASGPSGSGWYPMSVLFSDIWMSDHKWLTITVTEGGAVGNVKTVNQGANAQIGKTFGTDFADAVAGRGAFENNKQENVRAIAALYPTWWNFVTLDSSPYKTFEEFLQKKGHIVPGKPGDAAELLTRRVMEVNGYDYEKFKKDGGKVSMGTYGDGANMLRDGIAQVAVGGGAPNVIAFSEVDATKPVRPLALTEETLKKLRDKGYGYTVDQKLPAGTYKNQKEAVPAVTTMGILIVNKNVSDDVVYEITKSLWKNVDRIKKEQPERGKWFDVAKGYNEIVDPQKNMHPGALKYYKEIGVAK